MKKLTFLFMLAFFAFNANARVTICILDRCNPGENGYWWIQPWESHNGFEDMYHLNCQDPGPNACNWPEGWPCSQTCPIRPDIVITNDDNTVIDVDLSKINEEILKAIENGETSGKIFMDKVQFFYKLEKDDKGTSRLTTTILTGKNMF